MLGLRWNHAIIKILAIALSLFLLIMIDGSIRDWVLVNRVPVIYAIMKWFSWIGKGWVLLLLLSVFLVFGLLRVQPLAKKAGVIGILSLAIVGIVVQMLKHLIGRPRPRVMDGGSFYMGPSLERGYDSFPSGHAISAFAVAAVLSLAYPRWRILWYGVAVLVAFSRVYTDSHFASDIVVGAVLGIFIARAVYQFYPQSQQA